jgi:hypothetical protein
MLQANIRTPASRPPIARLLVARLLTVRLLTARLLTVRLLIVLPPTVHILIARLFTDRLLTIVHPYTARPLIALPPIALFPTETARPNSRLKFALPKTGHFLAPESPSQTFSLDFRRNNKDYTKCKQTISHNARYN